LRLIMKLLTKGQFFVFSVDTFASLFVFFDSLFHYVIFMELFSVSREKSDKEIMREIQAIMRQVASSVTYLPCLDETCKNQFIGTLSDHFETSLLWILVFDCVCFILCIRCV